MIDNIKKVITYSYSLFIVLNMLMIFSCASQKYKILYFVLCLIFILFVIKRLKVARLIKKVPKNVWITLIAIFMVIGVVLRIILIGLNYNEPTSDYATFFWNAENFASNNTIVDNNYISIFPFLTPYIILLGNVFKILGIKYSSVIILNVFLDILSAILLYISFRDRKHKYKSLVLSMIWLINPINIIWCAFCAPITVVNFLFVVGICIFELRGKCKKDGGFLLVTLALGIVLGIANLFRPIFIIFLIALILYDIYIIIFNKNRKLSISLISIAIIVISYFVIGKIGNLYIQNIVGQEVAKTAGWTVYLGANTKSQGSWNYDDAVEFGKKVNKNPFSAEIIQKEFKEKAIQRIKNNGIKSNIKLIFDKFQILTGNMGEYSKNSFWNIQNSSSNIYLERIVGVIIKLFVFSLVLSNLFIMVDKKYKDSLYMHILLCIGLITSHLFVEVSCRYSIHIIIPISIVSVFTFYDILITKQELQ